jgi:hypothetical protein
MGVCLLLCSVALWTPILLGWSPICICDHVGIILCFFWIFLMDLTTKNLQLSILKHRISLWPTLPHFVLFCYFFVVIICIFLSLLLHCYFYAHWRGTNAVYFPAVGYFPFLLVYDCSFSNEWSRMEIIDQGNKSIVPQCWSWTHLLLLDNRALFSLMFILKAQYVAVTEVFHSTGYICGGVMSITHFGNVAVLCFHYQCYCSRLHLDFLSFFTALFRIDCGSFFRVHKHEWYLQHLCCCFFSYFSLCVLTIYIWNYLYTCCQILRADCNVFSLSFRLNNFGRLFIFFQFLSKK